MEMNEKHLINVLTAALETYIHSTAFERRIHEIMGADALVVAKLVEAQRQTKDILDGLTKLTKLLMERPNGQAEG